MKRNRPLTDAEIEKELELLYGIPDFHGSESEDGLEVSDTEENLENILTGRDDESSFPLEPDFADMLLERRSRRRRGKHGPEQATDEWEEDDEHESEDEIDEKEKEDSRREEILRQRNTASEGTTDCESENGEDVEIPIRRSNLSPSRDSLACAPSAQYTPNNADVERLLIEEETSDSDEDEIEWKKTGWENTPDVSSFDEESLRPRNFFPSRSRPISYFEIFFDDEVIEHIIVETNLFATQANIRNFTPVTQNELKAYLGMLIQMAIHKLPSVEDYWSSNPALCVPEIAETMTLQRFQKISKCLHLNDNEKMPKKGEPGFDVLYKIRPL